MTQNTVGRVVIFLFLVFPCVIMAQNQKFYGTVLHEQTGAPVANVNLKIRNSDMGAATNNEGKFALSLPVLPVVIDITCIGYESLTVEVVEVVKKPVEIRLRSVIRLLEGVTISDLKATALFRDEDYSVLDYEIMNDNLLLLVFRYQLKRSVMLLLNREGDTLATSFLPETPPEKLYRDILGNVHFFSKSGNAYQCHFDPSLRQITFPFRTTADSLLRYTGNMTFRMNNRLYFKEDRPGSFTTRYGFYDPGKGKKYIETIRDESTASGYYRDMMFFLSPSWPGDTLIHDYDLRAYEMFAGRRLSNSMINLRDNRLALFNFSEDRIEILDPDGHTLEKIPISFHKEEDLSFVVAITRSFFRGDQWRWSGKLLKDEWDGSVYTSYTLHGMVRLRKIDILSGTLTGDYFIPMPFAEKITIYHETAYFLYKGIGTDLKWKLYRMALIQNKNVTNPYLRYPDDR